MSLIKQLRYSRVFVGAGLFVCLSSLVQSIPAAQDEPSQSPRLAIGVDARVELLSLLFRLAGNPEYNQGRVGSYSADVETHFKDFAGHRAVKLAQRLRRSNGVSYDACMSMAVHLTDAVEPRLRVSLKPWPEGLDRRWKADTAEEFVAAAGEFAKDSSFEKFLADHRALYDTTGERLKKLVDAEAHLEWFGTFFGERPQASFRIVPALLNGGGCYGARVGHDGREELFCILGVWKTDGEGLPEFTRDMLGTVVHEFAHSYANPVLGRRASELRKAGDAIFEQVSRQMRSQAYGSGQTVLQEYLVRACVARYLRHYEGEEAAVANLRRQKQRGFHWIDGLDALLAHYEADRAAFPTLETFAPRLVAFFNDTARALPQEEAVPAGNRPRVLATIPPNGATDVDPGLSSIQIVFDRRMRNGSWSMVGGGPRFPELAGQPAYDTSVTKWSVGVKLKPDWNYQFMINSAEFKAFESDDGVPVEPLTIKFKTGSRKQ